MPMLEPIRNDKTAIPVLDQKIYSFPSLGIVKEIYINPWKLYNYVKENQW